MNNQPLFTKNNEGRVVQLESFVVLSPVKENSIRILFGGKILESIDEISGMLANLYLAREGFVASHSSENVHFFRPIRTTEMGRIMAHLLLVTEKIICVYVEVWGGKATHPDNFTLRYAGFGLCAVINEQTEIMVKDLEPYRDLSNLYMTEWAEKVVEFDRSLRKAILNRPLIEKS